jgi:hypothetical protein
MVRALTGRMTPFSVMMPAISSAGVTSKGVPDHRDVLFS